MGGFVDSIAGGGGLITIPAFLAVGLPSHIALGTNKVQSSTYKTKLAPIEDPTIAITAQTIAILIST